jgi:hypothetical protein
MSAEVNKIIIRWLIEEFDNEDN